MTKALEFTTKILDIATNSALVTLFTGIVVVAGTTTYVLSPHSYESTIQKREVLGANDSKSSDFAAPIEENSGIIPFDHIWKLRDYQSANGYISFIEIPVENDSDEVVDIVSISNNSYADKLYRFVVRGEGIEKNDKIIPIIDRQPANFQVGKNSVSVDLNINVNESKTFSLFVKNSPSSSPLGIQVEAIEIK